VIVLFLAGMLVSLASEWSSTTQSEKLYVFAWLATWLLCVLQTVTAFMMSLVDIVRRKGKLPRHMRIQVWDTDAYTPDLCGRP
jgi:hypothetical protein